MSHAGHSHAVGDFDGRTAVNAGGSKDPTGTTTLRREYAGKASKRYRRVKGQVRRVVEEADALGFSSNVADRYNFPRNDAEKLEEFNAWLGQALDDEVLERPNSQRWTDKYVRSSYESGVRHADRELRKQGVEVADSELRDVFNMPVHQRQLQAMYVRQFQALEGINRAVDREVSRVLTEALSEGVNPRVAASRINDRVDSIGITRARTMARTEIVRNHNEAALSRYEQHLGSDGRVTVRVEWATATDSRVCPECASMGGTEYKLKEVRNMLPAHPRCRCTYIPVVNT